LDLIVNILTNHAVQNKQITVFGGEQKRPNIHIDDVTDLYVNSLIWPEEVIDGNIYNAGYDNQTVNELAEAVQASVGEDVKIVTTPTDDLRSYHISSDKIEKELGFIPQRSTKNAVEDLVAAFKDGKIPDPMTDIRYYNIRQMQALSLK
jgi:nucleoside-diphosphate-sugar epimerase